MIFFYIISLCFCVTPQPRLSPKPKSYYKSMAERAKFLHIPMRPMRIRRYPSDYESSGAFHGSSHRWRFFPELSLAPIICWREFARLQAALQDDKPPNVMFRKTERDNLLQYEPTVPWMSGKIRPTQLIDHSKVDTIYCLLWISG